MELNISEEFKINPDNLMASRTCLISQSGGGKSYAIGVICEELCKNKLGFAIIDPEGEYAGLKEKYDILWIGNNKNSELRLEKIDFKKLANLIISKNIPVILDVSNAVDEKKSVSDFCSALYEEESRLRMPYLLILEEADKYSPNIGKGLMIIEEIARRGRKRGLGLLIASQRPAFVNKNILSQCNNQFLGKLTIKNDIDAVKVFFSDLKETKKLTSLKFQFVAQGDISLEHKTIKFRTRETSPLGYTPKIKEIRSESIENILKSLGVSEEIIEERKETEKGIEIIGKIKEKEEILKKLSKLMKKKFLLFGEKTENIEKIDAILKPILICKISYMQKSILEEKNREITVIIDNESLKTLEIKNNKAYVKEDLSIFENKEPEKIRVLFSLLNKEMTILDICRKTGMSEETARKIIKELEKEKIVSEIKKIGNAKVYALIKKFKADSSINSYNSKIDFPAERRETEVKIEEIKTKEESIENFFKSLNPKSVLTEKKIVYLPYYKVTLLSGSKKRVIILN